MKLEEAYVGLHVRVREEVWREWCIRNFEMYVSFKPQPITQLPGAPPYNQYILLAYPYYLWRPEELEICEGEVGP